MARMPSPYREIASDGKEYYVWMGTPVHLLSSYENLFAALRIFTRTHPRTVYLLREIIEQMEIGVDRAAWKTAKFAEDAMREHLEATRVRPRGAKSNSGHGRLADGLQARPLQVFFPRGSGALGIAPIEELEAATKTDRGRYPFYWGSQEDGSYAMVGHYAYGAFRPGDAPPRLSDFRKHATFQSKGPGTPNRYRMVVSQPVQARNFIKDGAGDAHVYREKQFKAVADRTAKAVRAYIAAVR